MSKLFVLNEINSIANIFLKELRCREIQKNAPRFRNNMERLGEVLAYEISKTFTYINEDVQSPLGLCTLQVPAQQVVLGVVLRAGIPFYQGFLNYFDQAESAFIAAYRGIQDSSYAFDIRMDYLATPSLDGKTLIVTDPMLATGRSAAKAIQSFLKYGTPEQIHLASVIASKQGVEYIRKELSDVHIWIAAIDEGLNEKSYIVPGLGDAGDLAFGPKM